MMLSALTLAAAASALRPLAVAHHPVTTTSTAAQALFDRGLTLFYAYNGSEGVHVFQAAEQLDPSMAMAYWGEALSYGRDINVPLDEPRFNKAHLAIEKAVALEAGASPVERAYIDAMRERYSGNWSDNEKAEVSYRAAMASAVAAYPQDDDLASVYVEALLENSGQALWKHGTSLPLNNDTSIMVNTLDRVIARNPTHIMANHLIIHIFEPSTDRSRATAAAARLDAMAFAPEDEHLAHMTAHTWVDTGQYAKAIAASSRALKLFDEYKATPGVDSAHVRYYGHDVSIGLGAALMLGNYAQADAFAKQMDAQRTARGAPANSQTMTALRFARWPDAATLLPKTATDELHLALAYEKLAHGDAAGAKTELAGWAGGTTHQQLPLALLGALAAQQGDRATADTRFAAALDAEQQQFEGENLPMFPTGEIMGATFFRIGDYAAAEKAYRATLERYPNDARALFGLSQTLAKSGKPSEALAAQHEFDALWKGGDSTLSMDTLL